MLIFGRFDGSVLQSTTDEDCMFLFNWFLSISIIKVGVISYKVVLSFASRY